MSNLIDTTGFPYVLDEYPGRQKKPLTEYSNIGTYNPPVDWATLARVHRTWSTAMPPSLHRTIRETPQKAVNVMVHMILFKAFARSKGVISAAGVVAWVNFTTIEPAYVALDDQESFRIISKEEYDKEMSA